MIINLSRNFADFYTLFDSPYEKDVPDYVFTDHVGYIIPTYSYEKLPGYHYFGLIIWTPYLILPIEIALGHI